MAAVWRNMEPPVDFSNSLVIMNKCNSDVDNFHNIPKSKSLRLRGGGDFNDKEHNKISYLSSIKFLWTGLPLIDFDQID